MARQHPFLIYKNIKGTYTRPLPALLVWCFSTHGKHWRLYRYQGLRNSGWKVITMTRKLFMLIILHWLTLEGLLRSLQITILPPCPTVSGNRLHLCHMAATPVKQWGRDYEGGSSRCCCSSSLCKQLYLLTSDLSLWTLPLQNIFSSILCLRCLILSAFYCSHTGLLSLFSILSSLDHKPLRSLSHLHSPPNKKSPLLFVFSLFSPITL